MLHQTSFKMIATLCTIFCFCSCASLDTAALGDLLGGQIPLDEHTVAAGLREALTIGSGRAVDSTSLVDGFLADELLRIAIPEQLSSVTSTLRNIGLNGPVNDLEIGMNRAAEMAAGEARSVLTSAVASLTIRDAFAILRGGDTAATDLFRLRTSDELGQRFSPLVASAMDEVGVARLYNQMASAYDAIPFTDKPELVNLESHVVDGTIDGLFIALAREEQKIRHDPMARTTNLLRRVFSSEVQ